MVAGGGLFVDMMKRATQTKQFAELDHAVRTKVEPYLYNKGKGKWIPIDKLVLFRNKERPRHKMVQQLYSRACQLFPFLPITTLAFLMSSFFPQLPPLKAMENPADYDIDKDMGDEDVDETKIGSTSALEIRRLLPKLKYHLTDSHN